MTTGDFSIYLKKTADDFIINIQKIASDWWKTTGDLSIEREYSKDPIKPHMKAKHMPPYVHFFYRFQWDEDKFGGVEVLRVYPGDIWLPDIELYNAKVSWAI